MARPRSERSMKGAAPTALLLILVGLFTVPFFKDVISRFLLFAVFGGVALIFVVFVVGGLLLLALRGAD